jgi:molybdopterin-dependent oxidoreductase alpha subunit
VGISERPSDALLEGIERVFGIKPPRAFGHDAVAAMQAMAEGHSKVLISLGGNLATALPHPARCAAAMRRLDLSVHIATKLNRSHLLVGKESIILPCLGRTELDLQATGPQSVTVEDSMSMVHASRGSLQPASAQLRSEPAIVAGIAQATLPSSKVAWQELIADYDRIREKIQAVLPEFADFNARIRRPGGFRLPLPPTERVWRTPSGKAEFILRGGCDTPAAMESATFLLASIRSHDQYNTTVYSLDDRYRGVFGRRDVLFMNDEDLRACHLKHGDVVDIVSHWPGGMTLRLNGITAIAYDIARGCVAAYYPETNCLLPLDHHDRQSGTPSYKSIPVRISRGA